MSLECCQLLRSRVLHRQNTTVVTSAPPERTASPRTAFHSPPRDPKNLPGDFSPLGRALRWVPVGPGAGSVHGGPKRSDLSSAVREAKSFNLLLGQTPLETTAECGPRKDCSV